MVIGRADPAPAFPAVEREGLLCRFDFFADRLKILERQRVIDRDRVAGLFMKAVLIDPELLLLPCHDLGSGKQFVFCVRAERMQLAAAHQIINILAGTVKNAACF
mgnify:CR=1 FL=1